MRLLLDEQFTPDIAQLLRERGHDVLAVAERPELISAEDETLLALSTAERRVLFTNNVRDFVPIATQWMGDGRSHYGLLLVSDQTLPRSRDTIGDYVKALDGFMREHPGEAALVDQVRWLAPRSD